MTWSIKLFFKANLVVILLFFACCTERGGNSEQNGDSKVYLSSKDSKVSIIKLIANPIAYNKKKIQVKGFVTIEFENSAIYLSEEDCENGIDKNGIWIDISKEQIKQLSSFNKHHVALEGVFDVNNEGHENNYSGSIKLTEIYILNTL